MTTGMGRRGESERGAILPLMAILLVVLMGTAAMAVDLGWLYWQSIEIQHGADIAALVGVVYEPDQRTEAHTAGIGAAAENGYVDRRLAGRIRSRSLILSMTPRVWSTTTSCGPRSPIRFPPSS